MTTDKKWAGTTFGSSYMHRSLIRLLRHTPVRAVYAFTNVFVIPVSLLLRPSGKSSITIFAGGGAIPWLNHLS